MAAVPLIPTTSMAFKHPLDIVQVFPSTLSTSCTTPHPIQSRTSDHGCVAEAQLGRFHLDADAGRQPWPEWFVAISDRFTH